MSKPLQFLLLLLIVAIVAGAAYKLTGLLMPRSTIDSHTWIHEQLGINSEQEKALAPIEARYARRKVELQNAIRTANVELAQAILDDRGESPRVAAAIEKIHASQGELQTLTMSHVFEMKGVLSQGQYDKVLRLTADALKAQDESSHK